MDVIIAKIKKTANSEIWVCLREFQSRQYVDIREYFLSGDDNQWHATKKGVMIAPILLSDVATGIARLREVSELGTVATIPKSKRDEIRIAYSQFANRRYGEIRLWYHRDGEEDKPSNKGVTFRLDLIEQLDSALAESASQLEANSESAIPA